MPDSPTSETQPGFVCDCEDSMRSACGGKSFEYAGGKSFCALHLPNVNKRGEFQKAFQSKIENKDFNFRGVWFPDEVSFARFDFSTAADFSDTTFSAAANFSEATFAKGETKFIRATFRGKADFGRATFAEGAHANFESATFRGLAHFSGATFSKEATAFFHSATFSAAADFLSATFGGAGVFTKATFSAEASFTLATFSPTANFNGATFGEKATADFSEATFCKAEFYSTTFSAAADFRFSVFRGEADFRLAIFRKEADFNSATFSAEANFHSAAFADHVEFAGANPVFTDTSALNLWFARIEKPEHVSFHTVTLRPHWFVNVDARKFEFTNVKWDWRTTDEEIESLQQTQVPSHHRLPKNRRREILVIPMQKGKVSSPHRLLAIACRHLAVNAEDDNRYEEASKFRYMAMEARRLESWRGFAPWRLSWWYWAASGYGERIFRAFLILLGIWFVAGLLYSQVGFARWEPKLANERDEVGSPLGFNRALTYSAGVMTLQKPEPKPATTAAQTAVLLETILGPIQAALLALAVRRKFMR
jgi:hypothetical protein